MKAEPDSRMVKGKDVAFSVDHFEKLGTSQWDGVRNHEAKNIMKEKMKVGDGVLFYHSNCKTPGVAAIAEVTREGYPDCKSLCSPHIDDSMTKLVLYFPFPDTAWDCDHPYFDPKTDQSKPTWFMVDVKFLRRLSHFVSLSLLQSLAGISSSKDLPDSVSYLTSEHLEGIREMALIKRGRLSVQPVEKIVFEAVDLLGEKGGWEGTELEKGKGKAKRDVKGEEKEEKVSGSRKGKGKAKDKAKKRKMEEESDDEIASGLGIKELEDENLVKKVPAEELGAENKRRSKRTKK